MNVIGVLMEIQRHPVNAQGEPTTPVVWESVCLEERSAVLAPCSSTAEALRPARPSSIN
jgi:hypothetical protein